MDRWNYYRSTGDVRGSWFDIADSEFGLMPGGVSHQVIADGSSLPQRVRAEQSVTSVIFHHGRPAHYVAHEPDSSSGVSGDPSRSSGLLLASSDPPDRERMRSTFESLIRSGIIRIIDAAMLAMLYIIIHPPVWGPLLNIFAVLTNSCNDGERVRPVGMLTKRE